MRYWLTRADPGLRQSSVKRFDPSHWTIDFPRGSMASVVSVPQAPELKITATFATRGDLIGLIYRSSEDDLHIGHQRELNRDYSRCTLSFRWRSQGVIPLDQANGPTLTIEGRDADGQARSWFVRLWNYATGTPTDAQVVLPFGELRSGYQPSSGESVHVADIDRMFISLVPPEYVSGSAQRFAAPIQAEIELSDFACTGSGSTIAINDTFVPEHQVRICTAYDDCYHLTPERVIDGIERLGYRAIINHYVGMSHYPSLTGAGLIDPGIPICEPARRWHESFAAIAKQRGYEIIWSLSFELLDQWCPESWKQRDVDGLPALTAYQPPSTLVSPAVPDSITYLGSVASAFVGIGVEAGLTPMVQVGEPWWWVKPSGKICIYDPAASGHWSAHEPIGDVAGALTAAQKLVLDEAGEVLAFATRRIVEAVRAIHADAKSHLLAYLPGVWRSDAKEISRANLPLAWAKPAFDILQLEDYEWVTQGRVIGRQKARAQVFARLGYGTDEAHYLAGFASSAMPSADWSAIVSAVDEARDARLAQVFVWALPQVFRDNITLFEGDPDVNTFEDVDFPLELGLKAEVCACFSTTVSTSTAGFEQRNVNWSQSRLRFDVGPGVRSVGDLQTLLRFFRAMRGNATAFRFRDPLDHSTTADNAAPLATDVTIGIGDGSSLNFPLSILYGSGELRRITRPVAASLRIAIDGSETGAWSLLDKGIIEFEQPPTAGALITAGFLFDVPVRFEQEQLAVSQTTHLAGEAKAIPLIEVREA
ncbi:hypothetical protein GCM10022281_01910 [Sphingomonas rosea]|uniref:TIGR02217 family protein n=1 Tax=Sphingomonas rosea TaxID=335605 RepID=A0ABP7TJ09_9SPHN